MKNIKLKPIIEAAIVAVILQIVMMVAGIIITFSLGAPPETPEEYFALFEKSNLAGLLADDSYNLVLIFLYIFSVTALFFMLKDHKFSLALYACLFVVISVVICLPTHSGFSMMHLSKQYLTSNDPAVKIRLIAAGEAVIAKNMWNSTSSFFSGILMQGGCFLIALAMIGSGKFGRLTIISGLLCNGLDLLNHLIHFNLPQVAAILLYAAGPFYIVWYITLIRDFRKNLMSLDQKEVEI